MTLNDACFLLLWSMKIKKVSNVLVLNMGKPIKIMNIIKSLIDVRKKIEPNYKFEIKEIGLQKGEKMYEQLTVKNKIIKTKNPDIFVSTDPKYDYKEIKNLLSSLRATSNPRFLKQLMLKFLKKEIRKNIS